MVLKISNHLGSPLVKNVGVSDIHGKNDAGKEKAWSSIAASPVTIRELKLLVKRIPVDGSIMEVLREFEQGDILDSTKLVLAQGTVVARHTAGSPRKCFSAID